MELEQIGNKACGIVLTVGQFIREQSYKIHEIKVEEKEVNSLVSYVDKSAEQQLVNELGKLVPDAGFLTEEDTEDITGKAYEWIIDPLDGTTNFLYGIPVFSISVALRHEEQLVLGIVYEISRDELFYAHKDSRTFLNNKAVSVSKRQHLSQCLLATGFPYYDFSRMDEYMKSFNYLMKNTRGLRRLGSAAVDMAYVACGRFDGFFEYSLHAWDIAAGIVLVKQAGGSLTDFSGGSDYLFGEEMVATNGVVGDELLKILDQSFD